MNSYVELWDADSGNRAADFANLDEAVAFLRNAIVEHGASVLAGYFLIASDEAAEPIADDALRTLVANSKVPSAVG